MQLLLPDHTISCSIQLSLLHSFIQNQIKSNNKITITIMAKLSTWTLLVVCALMLAMASVANACAGNGTPVSK